MFLEVLLRTQSTNERIEGSVFAKPNSLRNHPFNRLTRITNCFLCTSLSINSSHTCTLHLHVHMLKELLTNSLHKGTLDLNVHMYRELLGRLFIDDDSVKGGVFKAMQTHNSKGLSSFNANNSYTLRPLQMVHKGYTIFFQLIWVFFFIQSITEN